MEQYTNLLSPGFVGKLKLRNRMIATATVTDMAGEDGLPTEQFIRYHEEKARGGWGMVITEDYAIAENAKTHVHLPGLWSDSQIGPHAELVRRVHEAGGTICAQLFHPGRAASKVSAGEDLMGPSPLRDPVMPETPREMTLSDIHEVIGQFAAAARRAKECGFDAIEIHGAHGYLINQFLSGFSNKRCDEYGGSVTNRGRFAREVVQAVREAVGPDYPISFRFSVCDHVPGGIGVTEACAFARMLEEAGVDLLNCSQGMPSSRGVITPPASVEPAHYVHDAAAIKKVVGIPMAVVGRIADPDVAEEVIASGMADFAGMGRAAIADPHFARKVAEGRPEDIIQCIACLRGCAGESRRGHTVHCALNPLTGREVEYAEKFADVSIEAKRIMVIGGGITGMQAALTAASLGHDVELLEASSSLGGQWCMAAMPPGKNSMSSFAAWQKVQLRKHGVKVMMGTPVTAEMVRDANPDAVIVATGSVSFVPSIPGLAESSKTVDARDVLSGVAAPRGRVVVLGGGLVGAETADLLASQGCSVTVVEMGPQIAPDAEPIPRAYLMDSLAERSVCLRTQEKVLSVEDGDIRTDKQDRLPELKGFDAVVTAFGARSNAALAEELAAAGYEGRVFTVGDAREVANAFENLKDAYEVARAL